jgi:hypothetical protein
LDDGGLLTGPGRGGALALGVVEALLRLVQLLLRLVGQLLGLVQKAHRRLLSLGRPQ